MKNKGFTRIAYTDPLGFGIDDNRDCFIQIGILIHIDMAVSGSCLDHRNTRTLHNRFDQSRTSARNHYIHILLHTHKLCRHLAVSRFDQLYGILGDPCLF